MCGICGWISLDGVVSDPSILTRMVAVLKHRGPDGTGEWQVKNYAIGHTRLSILDHEGGSQPMVDDGGLAITFNGEIYNYREIAAKLEARGVVFRTRSDTEVVLKAYREWGDSCVEYLEGMFAFAIADPTKKRLYLARDHFGKKPLYYFFQQGMFIFGSEIKAILQSPIVRNVVEIDDQALIDYLSLGYILAPKTMFKEIRQIQPASYVVVDLSNRTFSERRYWKYEEYFHQQKTNLKPAQLEDQFRTIFHKAVETRLHADVPVGGFLSSGLDSATVAATAGKLAPESFKTFSIGFKEASFDESTSAERISASLGIDLEVQYFEELTRDKVSQIVWHFDQPFSDNSAYPTYQLNRLAGKFGKVMISGDGADEMFAGYPTYRADQFFSIYSKLPTSTQKTLSSFAQKWVTPSYRKVSRDYKIRQFLGAAGLTRQQAHYWWRSIFPEREIRKILDPEVIRGVEEYSPLNMFLEYFSVVKGLPFLDQTLFVDSQTWLPDDILVKVDRMSMAHSVEVRCPFLDINMAQFAANLPVSQKLNSFGNKRIVRKSMQGRIPPLARRSRKLGFNTPSFGQADIDLPEDARFMKEFRLHPDREDVTFKKNNLLVLKLWFDMFSNYKNTGRWEPVSYGC